MSKTYNQTQTLINKNKTNSISFHPYSALGEVFVNLSEDLYDYNESQLN